MDLTEYVNTSGSLWSLSSTTRLKSASVCGDGRFAGQLNRVPMECRQLHKVAVSLAKLLHSMTICLVSCIGSVLLLLAIAPFTLALAQEGSRSPIGVWNTFLGQVNIVECANSGAEAQTVQIVVRSNEGTQLYTSALELRAGGTQHLILTELPSDAYGTFSVAVADSGMSLDTVHCLTSFYRQASANSLKPVDYVFTLPALLPASPGVVWGAYNSMNPNSTTVPVQNWLSLVNTGEHPLSGQIEIYDQSGNHRPERNIIFNEISPGSRVDFAVGHQWGLETGLYAVRPASISGKYRAFVVRYGRDDSGDYRFAFPLAPQTGSCDLQSLPLSTMDPALNWVVVANPTSNELAATISFHNAVGTQLQQRQVVLAPHSQHHILANEIIGEQSVGSVKLSCQGEFTESVGPLLESYYYGRLTVEATNLEWAYGTQAQRRRSQPIHALLSLYNTYLGAANWQKIFNESSSGERVTMEIRNQIGEAVVTSTVSLDSESTIDYSVHEAVGMNVLGNTQLSLASGDIEVSTELIRVFPVMSNGQMRIGYITKLDSFPVYRNESGNSSSSNSGPAMSSSSTSFSSSSASNGTSSANPSSNQSSSSMSSQSTAQSSSGAGDSSSSEGFDNVSPDGWVPPLGIHEPEFGITENYRMYDAIAARNSAITYHPHPLGENVAGFYTHYVDNSNANCWDEPNRYGRAIPTRLDNFGTVNSPRCSIPVRVPAGSVVLLAGGPYAGYTSGNMFWDGQGTADHPVFFRSASPDERTIIRGASIRLGGSYLIIEDLKLESTSVNLYRFTYEGAAQIFNRIAIRYLEISGVETGSAINVGNGGYATTATHIVIFSNHIHHNGNLLTDTDSNSMGVGMNSNVRDVWILDNHLHHNGADSIHGGHQSINLSGIYIGRNVMHDDRENAIDLKQVSDVVISQNRAHGYRAAASSNGDAVRINDEGVQDNIWFIFNEVYDSTNCLSIFNASFRPVVLGNLFYDCIRGVYDTNLNNGVHSMVAFNTLYNVSNPLIGLRHQAQNVVNSANHQNVPVTCSRNEAFSLTEQAEIFSDGGRTKVRVPGVNLEQLGLRPNDRVALPAIPEVRYNSTTCPNGCLEGGSSTRPICGNQWVDSVLGDTVTLYRNIACPGANLVAGVPVSMEYYPIDGGSSSFYVESPGAFSEGDKIEHSYDGHARVITQIERGVLVDYDGVARDRVHFDIPLGTNVERDRMWCDWGSATSLTRDFSFAVSGVGVAPTPEFAEFSALWGLSIDFDISGAPRPAGGSWQVGAFE